MNLAAFSIAGATVIILSGIVITAVRTSLKLSASARQVAFSIIDDVSQAIYDKIEFYVGSQCLAFNTSTGLFITRRIPHGPIICRECRKPHPEMVIMCGAGMVKEGWCGSFKTDPVD